MLYEEDDEINRRVQELLDKSALDHRRFRRRQVKGESTAERVRFQAPPPAEPPKDPDDPKPRKIRRYFDASQARIDREYGHIISLEGCPVVRRWTISSANCYFRNQICKGCENAEFCEKANYIMKKIVRKLVQEIGVERIYLDIPEVHHNFLDKVNFNSIIEGDDLKT